MTMLQGLYRGLFNLQGIVAKSLAKRDTVYVPGHQVPP